MTDAHNIYTLGLGSNLGQRRATLERAIVLIGQRAGEILRQTSFIETEPWGYATEQRFINVALSIASPLEPHELLAVTQQIEHELGRRRSITGGYADRTIDIDILECGHRVIYSPTLRLPHPRMWQREFVLQSLDELRHDASLRHRRVATIGYFDGIHLGHRHLIAQLRQRAAAEGVRPLVLTFDRHPRTVVDPSTPFVPTLCSPEMKALGVSDAHCADFMTLEFTPTMAALSAREFMRLVLRDQLNVGTLLVGYDHHFGHRGPQRETFEDYCRYGREIGLDVIQATELTEPRGTSSSAIRRALAAGDIATANAMLGRTYSWQGNVVHGHKLGRLLGFPTVNLQARYPQMMLPQCGVYAAWASVSDQPRPDGGYYMAMVNIGTRPTVDDSGSITVEAHLLDFHDDIYGRDVELFFDRCIRKEQRFESEQELINQLCRDRDTVRRVLTHAHLCLTSSGSI